MTSEEITPPADSTPTAESAVRSPEERKAILASAVASSVGRNTRVESQSDYQAVLVSGKRVNHTLHLLLTIITFGFWGLLVWLPLGIFGGESRKSLSVDDYGNIQRKDGSFFK